MREKEAKLKKLSEPYTGDVPQLPKFDTNMAPRHFGGGLEAL
jgi:hypothetical protein